MSYIACEGLPANCEGRSGQARAIARRLWRGYKFPGEPVGIAGRTTLDRLHERPGRVESGGAFEDSGFLAGIRAALPPELRSALRTRLEWYGCRGAFFHNDAHYDGVLFGVWCVSGPQRDLVFPRIEARVPANVGNLAVFDPFEPHGVLSPGARTYESGEYQTSAVSLFLGFELTLTPEVLTAFGVDAPHASAPTFSSRVAIHPATGVAVTSTA